MIVPEVKDKQTTGLTLLHLRFHDHLPPATMRAVLTGYQGRFSALKDAVTETEPTLPRGPAGHAAGASTC